MRYLVPTILIVVSILHTWVLASTWPNAILPITPTAGDGAGALLLQTVLAFCITCALAISVSLLLSKRFVSCVGVLVTVALAGMGYLYLPLSKVFLPSLAGWGSGVIGVVCGVAACWAWFARAANEDDSFPRFSVLTAFCIVYNLLLLIAPSSVIFPTGYAGNVTWAHDTLLLRHEDSVSIHNNLLFIIIRWMLAPIVGSSIIANSLVSSVMVSLGLALLVMGIQRAAGSVVALCALLLMVSERWVMVTAFSGNLPASLVTTCGLVFYVCMRVAFDPPHRSKLWHVSTFGLLVLATLLSLYSYAAVRMPFLLSVSFTALLYAIKAEGPWMRRVIGALVWVVSPVVCGFLIMGLGPYKGGFSGLRHDFLVTWPKDSIVAHPGPDGLRNYQLERNFDTPLWQQIARPIDGTNRSVIWTKTPLETVMSFLNHLVDIANNVADLFFIQPLSYFLLILGLCSLSILSTKMRALFVVCLLWSCIWLSTFLMVPDATAFRRAVAFPGSFAVVVALAVVPLIRSRMGQIIAVALCGAVVAARAPYELAVANKTEARMRMFTLCATAPAHRALLTSPLMEGKKWGRAYILSNGIYGGKEAECFDNAIASSEWQRLMPPTSVFNANPEQALSELERLPSGALVMVYCNFDSKRVSYVNMLCTSGIPHLRPLGEVPNSYDGAHWMVFETL